MTPVAETCACGATYYGDPFSALVFRDAHATCRERCGEIDLLRRRLSDAFDSIDDLRGRSESEPQP